MRAPVFLRLGALASLRIGEERNCLPQHDPDACLFPIRGGVVHTDPDGTRGASRAAASSRELDAR